MNEGVEILIADDDGGTRTLLASILRNCDYPTVTYAADGEEALRLLKQKNFHMAFLDISMPGVDGVSVLKQAKDISPKCFCVIITAHSAVENVKAALGAGAKGFIVKPYSAQKVTDVLAKFEQQRYGDYY